jgi:peptidyl-prolyl cis-trans isomerase D
MMTKLREYSKIFIIILALAFIGLMVFEWGMDYTGLRRRQNVVGKVNGEELTYEKFSDLYQQAYQNERQRRDVELNDTQLENLRTQVWDQFVQRVIFQEEIDRLGISVTDSEIVYQIRHYPLDEIKSNQNFQTNGQFDWNKYYASFSNPQMPWAQIEEFYRQQLPYQKLQDLITASVRVSESELENEFMQTNLKARVQYLEIPYARFRSDKIEISDEEALNFYNDHISEFEQEETRQLSYVFFPLTPSKQDTARVLDEFAEIKKRLANGEDFNDLADEYSEDPAKATNHGRYDYFERGSMVKPFEDACFNGKVGSVVGPVKTQYGYHLIKIEDKRMKDGKEQVKASHILLKVSPGPSTHEAVSSQAAFFAEDAGANGFEAQAATNHYEIKKTGPLTEKSSFIPGLGRDTQAVRFAFSNSVDAISDVISLENGFAVFKLDEVTPAGPKPFDEVKTTIINRLRIEKQKETAKKYASQFDPAVTSGENFRAIAASDTGKIARADTTTDFTMRGSIPGLGLDPVFNATAFSLEPGHVSGEIETNRGIYWQKLLSKTDFDSARFKMQRASLEQRLLAQKKNQAFSDWYDYLKSRADIEDNRKMFNL